MSLLRVAPTLSRDALRVSTEFRVAPALSAYTQFHRASLATPSPSTRYLYFVTWAGFANRVLALLSALVLAILTDRVLLVDDDAFPAGLFELPIRWLASECAYFSALPRTPDEWRVVETEQTPFTAELAYLGCANLSAPRVLEYRSIAQYVVPVLLRNPNLRGAALLRELGDSPVQSLLRYLLPPSARVRERLAELLADAPQRPRSVGLQLRMHNTWVRAGNRRLTDWAARCALHGWRAFGDADAVVHVASDDDAARAIVRRTVTARGVPSVTSLALGSAATSENMTDAWLELLALSQSDALVTTGGSSFGYLARALSRAPPDRIRVLTGWDRADARPFALSADCPTVVSREPCLMHAWRADWQVDATPCFRAAAYDERTLAQLLRPMERRSSCF